MAKNRKKMQFFCSKPFLLAFTALLNQLDNPSDYHHNNGNNSTKQ